MKFFLITSNSGKVREFSEEFSRLDINIEHRMVEYSELQADSLEEVIRFGLRELREKGWKNFIIDDSGLFIEAYSGFPGVYSAYVLKTLGCMGILKLMEGVEERSASFRCCIGCWSPELGEIVVESEVKGEIAREERGREGFGFDPIFIPEGETRSYAEMSLREKNMISHRGVAIRSLAREIEKRLEGGSP